MSDKGVVMKPRLSASLSTLLGVAFLLGTPSALCWGQAPTEAEALSASFRKASRKVLPAVITVRAAGAVEVDVDLRGLPIPDFVPLPGGRLFSGRFGMPGSGAGSAPSEGGGSGVVIDADKGYILTNDHLVAGASTVRVVLHDGRERVATQIRHDPRSDLALLVVDPKGLTPAAWGDSEAIDTGDWVLAIGQPFGLADTVTAGIISGKGRGLGGTSYEDLIQTDAAINPGNSGGPLVNLKGEIVGINTAIRTSRGSYEGIGFAVPASRAKRVAADLAQYGRGPPVVHWRLDRLGGRLRLRNGWNGPEPWSSMTSRQAVRRRKPGSNGATSSSHSEANRFWESARSRARSSSPRWASR